MGETELEIVPPLFGNRDASLCIHIRPPPTTAKHLLALGAGIEVWRQAIVEVKLENLVGRCGRPLLASVRGEICRPRQVEHLNLRGYRDARIKGLRPFEQDKEGHRRRGRGEVGGYRVDMRRCT